MNAITASDTKITLSPDVVVTPLDDGALLLHLESKFFYSINLSGWSILQLLEGGATLHDVVSRCTEWGAQESDRDAIQKYLEHLMKDCLAGDFEGRETGTAVQFKGNWNVPTVERHDEPLERIVTSAFDPSVPLAE